MNGFAPGSSSSSMTWTAAKTKKSRGYPSFQTKNEGFFQRSRRKISTGIPRFNSFKDQDWKDTEKLGRGRWYPRGGGQLGRLKTFIGSVLRRFKFVILVLVLILLSIWGMNATSMVDLPSYTTVMLTVWTDVQGRYRRNARLGGGSKFVIILGANEGGGVMEWKGPREWAIERDSVKNKRKYAQRWGYDLEIVDMSTKKRYAHEWRESWEKVDVLRTAMAKYPNAEW
jgi:mannan polymerase II complex MNN10 subunit